MCPAMQWSPSQADGRRPPTSTPRNRRQEETFRKVLAAGMEMLRESSYADLTVRAVAARAKVAPATAYTYFSSKNHLIAEVYLDLMKPGAVLHRRQRPDAESASSRPCAAWRWWSPTSPRSPRRAPPHCCPATTPPSVGCATASAPRSTAASGPPSDPNADPRIVAALEMTFFGALVNAGSGAFTYHQIADRLSYVVGLILGEDR